MNSHALRFYQRCPPPLRSTIATLRGYYLRAWRYGFDTEALVHQALERQSWTGDQWAAYQAAELRKLLHAAATKVPFYRSQWAERRRRGDRASWEELQNWPILEKENVRARPRAFVSDDSSRRFMFREHSSGTTGKPLELWQSRRALKQWYALSEARWRRWYGVSRRDRWGMLGGQLVTPVSQRRPPFWVWNAALNQLYLSSYHLSPDFIPHYLEALKSYGVRYLLGYTSALYALAREALRLGRSDVRMRIVIANAEPVFDYQRTAIETAFSCPLRETYGMSEFVAAASECESRRLHLWPEAGYVEVLEGSTPVRSGSVGDLVCTGLLNREMPLIRYRVGDRGSVRADACPCGRGLPLVATVEGRCDDVLLTRDGRRIGRLDPVFKAGLPIQEAQIVQEAVDRIRLRYVPAPEFAPAAARMLVERLRDRLGDVEVVMESLPEIPRGANGKFRAVVCQLPDTAAESSDAALARPSAAVRPTGMKVT